ncbi:MAG TPA: pitrilysin family protein, partial [Polyangiaceae bacterium]|nr:pitrilysin family protein [Polyangiaceae bacterium]
MRGASRAKTASSVRWRVRHYDDVLPNGLRVLAVPRKSASRATATMLFRVGSRYETSESNGISHFLEHMLYRGSPSLKTSHDQALAFEELGASLYAATQSDYGTMNLTLPPESVGKAIALFAEVVDEPRFSAIEIERGIVREEILEDLDDEGRQIDADNLVRELVYGTHPLGFTITGSLAQLARFDRRMLRRHHARHYTAKNAVLCFGGAIDPDDCFRLARRHFARLSVGDRVEPGAPPAPQKKRRMRHVPNVSSQTTLRVAFRAMPDKDPAEPALEMLLRVLDDGMATRLYERICDSKGLCYDVGALYEAYEDDGVFDVAAEAQHDRVVLVAREIFGVLAELASAGPTERELERTKARNRWQTHAMQDDSEALAGYYALAALSGLAPTPRHRHDQLADVTVKDVQTAAERVFRGDGLSVVTVGSLTHAQEEALS